MFWFVKDIELQSGATVSPEDPAEAARVLFTQEQGGRGCADGGRTLRPSRSSCPGRQCSASWQVVRMRQGDGRGGPPGIRHLFAFLPYHANNRSAYQLSVQSLINTKC